MGKQRGWEVFESFSFSLRASQIEFEPCRKLEPSGQAHLNTLLASNKHKWEQEAVTQGLESSSSLSHFNGWNAEKCMCT